ncbi:MAG: class I SAM-dependent methyltransferase [Oscillospiraceae bacterium]|nr:class I SAM-dependent methyltransferase [Oscillospiraceae bacterium]
MSAYAALAEYYDELTGDVPYNDFADYYERLFREYSVEVGLVLDLCCGTGSLTCEMAARGYELIAADASADMLMRARDKAYSSALAKNAALYKPERTGAGPLRHGGCGVFVA